MNLVITVERPTVTESPKTFDRPTRCGDAEGDHEDDYLFYIESAIVGRVSTDCYVCAWKEGHPRWREAKMAISLVVELPVRECRCESLPAARKVDFLFYEQNTIVGTLMAYCYRIAWKESHSVWPLAAIAGHIPMSPADVSLRCRKSLK